jgi:hypothetical protein
VSDSFGIGRLGHGSVVPEPGSSRPPSLREVVALRRQRVDDPDLGELPARTSA